jgi:hypothetical protein
MSIPDPIEHGLAQQRVAANPEFSVWVSANAGAGKTHVLTARIVNLLLGQVHGVSASSSAACCCTGSDEMSVDSTWPSGRINQMPAGGAGS